MAASQKLSHLLQLAGQGRALRSALAEEVAELLIHWPPDYSESMRDTCEALLARVAHELDAATRARLRVQLFAHPQLVSRVLPRQPAALGLVETARQGGDLAVMLALRLGMDEKTAEKVLTDQSGVALAMACKGAGLDRAAFSALALLAHPGRDRIHSYAVLDVFDSVPTSEAERVLRGWRKAQAAA